MGSQDPLGGRYGGSNFFFPHPLPQNPLVRFRDFDGFEVHGGPTKNPENFSKIDAIDHEILTQVYDEPMGRMGQGVKRLNGVDYSDGYSFTTQISRFQKGKTSLDLNEARDDGVWGCTGISWTICKQSAPRCRQITTSTAHHSIFYRPDALPDTQPTVTKH